MLARMLSVSTLTLLCAGAPVLFARLLVMTYSEFGRRVEENASSGTDHGTSAPVFILGGRVKGGFYGAQPALAPAETVPLFKP